jgi:hypothetical protein
VAPSGAPARDPRRGSLLPADVVARSCLGRRRSTQAALQRRARTHKRMPQENVSASTTRRNSIGSLATTVMCISRLV